MPDLLRGIIPPVLLPMGRDGAIDSASLERHVRHLLDSGVHGLWINGSTGEFYALDCDQRGQVVREAVKAAAGAVPVVAHVGDTSTPRTLDHAKAALAAGASQLAVIPPYYVDFAQEELRDHFRAVAELAGGPVLAYHIPQLVGPGLTVDSIIALAEEGVVNGVKDSGTDPTWFRKLLTRARQVGVVLQCFTGGSSLVDVGLFLGGAGVMSSLGNVTPRYLVAMYDAAQASDWDRVRAMQEDLEALIAAIQLPRRSASTASATPGVYKHVLAKLGRIDADVAAGPLAPLDDDERERIDATAVPIIERLEQAVE